MALILSFREVAWLLGMYQQPLPPLVSREIQRVGEGDAREVRSDLQARGLIAPAEGESFTLDPRLAEVIATCVEWDKIVSVEGAQGLVANILISGERVALLALQDGSCLVDSGVTDANSKLLKVLGAPLDPSPAQTVSLSVSTSVGEALLKAYVAGGDELERLCGRKGLNPEITRRLLAETDFDPKLTTGFRFVTITGLQHRMATTRLEFRDGGFWALRFVTDKSQSAETFESGQCDDLLGFVTDFTMKAILV